LGASGDRLLREGLRLAPGLGDLESRDTPTYAVAKALQILRMLLLRMERPKSEPVTLEAVDIPSQPNQPASHGGFGSRGDVSPFT